MPPDVAEEYEVPLANDPNLVVAALVQPASRRVAELRAGYRLHPAGAWQVASCREPGATAFLSNDRDRRRLTDLPVWMLEDFV